jgi:hypothetical protein
MDGIVQPNAIASKLEPVLEEAVDASDQPEKLQERIKQLLKESCEAKEKGQWKKAWDLLIELSEITRV